MCQAVSYKGHYFNHVGLTVHPNLIFKTMKIIFLYGMFLKAFHWSCFKNKNWISGSSFSRVIASLII